MSLVITLDLTNITTHTELVATLRRVAEDIGNKLACTDGLHVLAPDAHPIILNEHDTPIGQFYLASHRLSKPCAHGSSDGDDHYGPDSDAALTQTPPRSTPDTP